MDIRNRILNFYLEEAENLNVNICEIFAGLLTLCNRLRIIKRATCCINWRCFYEQDRKRGIYNRVRIATLK